MGDGAGESHRGRERRARDLHAALCGHRPARPLDLLPLPLVYSNARREATRDRKGH